MTTRGKKRNGLERRFAAFVTEKYPYAATAAVRAYRSARKAGGDGIESLREPLREALLAALPTPTSELPDPTPGVSATLRLEQARADLLDACDGFLRREAIVSSLSSDERREILRGMVFTRAVDNQLKAFFTSGEVRFENVPFQGKGFRSLGQEAIFAAPLRFRRGPEFRDADGAWHGDVIAPVIRDLGAALAMRLDDESIRMALSAQMGKAGRPMGGKDLHFGDPTWGVLPAAAPLAVSSLTAVGLAMGFAREGSDRISVSFIGEGGSSLGEWHEAINAAAVRRLPVLFCIQNNQTALSTPVGEQSGVRVFADKGLGYGVPSVTVDGTDPEAIAAAFAWGAERARSGLGPILIELVAMRMCGHAHHDDMLYLGRDPDPSWDYPPAPREGYADANAYRWWAGRDPIPGYAARLENEGVIGSTDLETLKAEAEAAVREQANRVVEAPWPEPDEAGGSVFSGAPPRRRIEVLDGRPATVGRDTLPLPPLETGPPFDTKGNTFLEAVLRGIGDALRSDPRVFVYGQDVGGDYGNAFLLLRPLLREFGDRILNSPLAEGAILGVCIGAALAGQRPIAEMQFNDFVATGFNQLVNNASMLRYRWGASCPLVVRMPWGGLRHAGPYHSQNTEPWFYRTPGLKIVTPSTPSDARALFASSVLDPDPVLYYEHIALYRNPRIKQALPEKPPEPIPLGRAALRRAGSDLAIVSYGAYVHAALRVAETLAREGIDGSVLDLRTLVPLDRDALLAVARHCGRVLIVHEDSRTGGIGESLAAIIQEEAFEFLDAPVRIVGALDTPVPYSPPLERHYLASDEEIERAARLLAAF